MMKFPSLTETIFSLKCMTAASLALYVAMYFDLQKPFWAMTTAYIVANPFSGPVRSKAIYRAFGTVLGSAVTLLIVPGFVQSPELLSLVMAGWVGLCLFLSLLNRTPRAYVFMLAGYTAALIGFPAVNDPGNMFDGALARVEEIMIGICAATLVHSLILPQSLGPAMMARLKKILQDMRQYMNDVFSTDQEQRSKDRRMLAADIAELRIMATHLPFDTSHLRWTSGVIYEMHGRLSFILPLLSGAGDRLSQLEAVAGKARCERWTAIVAAISDWVEQSQHAQVNDHTVRRQRLLAQIDAAAPALKDSMDWADMLEVNLATRLRDLVQLIEDVLGQHANIAASFGGHFPVQSGRRLNRLRMPEHYDYWLAALSSLAAVAAILGCCAFWIATAWPAGPVAAMMGAVFCCFFAVQDDPVPSIKNFLYYTLLSVPVSALYVIWILPSVHYFATLILALAPMLFVLGLFLSRPASAPKSIAMVLGILGSLALQERDLGDVAAFVNSTIAQTIGVIAAVVATSVLRTVSTAWRARRLLKSGRQDLLVLLSSRNTPEIEHLAARMLDRIAQLTPRLAALKTHGTDDDWHTVDAMQDCRIGLNIAQLLRCRPAIGGASVSLKPLLDKLARHFSSGGKSDDQPQLSAEIDALLSRITALPGLKEGSLAITALVGLRRDVCPDSPLYLPALSAPLLLENPP